MGKYILIFVAILLVAEDEPVAAVCCGNGVHGFCKDCSAVSLWRRQKCCGIQSCNVFCCNCRTCRTGKPLISYASGWFLSKKYTCKKTSQGDATEVIEKHLLDNTKAFFKSLDKDDDGSISVDEFLNAMQSLLNDDENGGLAMSRLLQARDEDEVEHMLDVVINEYDDDISDEDAENTVRMILQEFREMDADGDGFIQAREFDNDL